MDRPITFRKLAAGHYRNDETDVEIIKVPAKRIGRGGHRVAGWSITAPSYGNGWGSRSEVGFATTKAAAEAGDATRIALATREGIARDYAEATAEEIDRAARHIDLSDRADVRSADADQYLINARQAWYRHDYDRARAWAKLAVEAYREHITRLVADSHTEAREEDALRRILPVATGQPEQVRGWMARHDIDPDAAVGVADAIATDYDEAVAEDARRFGRLMREEEVRRSPNRVRYAYLAHVEAIDMTACGEEFDGYGPTVKCARPAWHADKDTIGHAAVRFPLGTPEYAAYSAELKAELGKWSRHEAPYDVPVRVGDLTRYAQDADSIRKAYRVGVYNAPAARAELMARLGVTEEGAQVLLNAPTTAHLA